MTKPQLRMLDITTILLTQHPLVPGQLRQKLELQSFFALPQPYRVAKKNTYKKLTNFNHKIFNQES
jgi:hypothetical protein